jgi:hypothetical protein
VTRWCREGGEGSIPVYRRLHPLVMLKMAIGGMRHAFLGRLPSCGRSAAAVPGGNPFRHLSPARSKLPPKAVPRPLPGSPLALRC